MQRTIPHRQKLTFAPDFLMSSFTKRQPYSAASNLLFAFYFVFIKVSLTITNPCKASAIRSKSAATLRGLRFVE